MKRNLYYVIDYEHRDVLPFNVSVYVIENNRPKLWFELDYLDADFGETEIEAAIQDWLNDNGYEDEEFEMEQI